MFFASERHNDAKPRSDLLLHIRGNGVGKGIVKRQGKDYIDKHKSAKALRRESAKVSLCELAIRALTPSRLRAIRRRMLLIDSKLMFFR